LRKATRVLYPNFTDSKPDSPVTRFWPKSNETDFTAKRTFSIHESRAAFSPARDPNWKSIQRQHSGSRNLPLQYAVRQCLFQHVVCPVLCASIVSPSGMQMRREQAGR
jgi:hypothetical protein